MDGARQRRPNLFEPADRTPPPETPPGSFNVPAKFVELARSAILHRDPERFAILYRLLWRLRSHHDLLEVATDPDVARCGDGQGGPPRPAQDAGLRSFSRNRARTDIAFRRLVRARASHRRSHRTVLRQPLRRHALVDPDAGCLRALGRPCRRLHAGRQPGRGAVGRPAGGNLAALLRQHLQSGPAEGEGDARRDAEEILEEPAGGLDH